MPDWLKAVIKTLYPHWGGFINRVKSLGKAKMTKDKNKKEDGTC